MRRFRIVLATTLNSIMDLIVYLRYSGIIGFSNQTKLLAAISFNYHTIEKGLAMDNLRLGFGVEKISIMLKRIKRYIDSNYDVNQSQFKAACSVLEQYYKIHQDQKYDVDSYFARSDFELIQKYSTAEIMGFKSFSDNSYFKFSDSSYDNFSRSRHSIRQFSKDKVKIEDIENSIEIAKFCPSACNRQSSHVYYVGDKTDIDRILKIQMGLDASSKYVNQLLVISTDRSHFFTSGERYQFYIDGGIFIQSVLLALHFNKIGACPLHWSVNFQKDKAIRKIIGCKKSEKVVALIAIGKIDKSFKVPYSNRKPLNEIFTTLKEF